MSERSARPGKRSEPSPKQTRLNTSRRGVTSTHSTNSASTCSTSSASTPSTAGSTSGPSGRSKRTSFSASGEPTSTPAAKQRRGTLTRNDIPDIVAAVLQAMPNSYTTANSPATGISQSQPSHSVDAANPTIQAVSRNRSSHAVNPTTRAVVLPDEELHHQELGEF